MDLKTLRASRNTDFSKISSEFEKVTAPGEKKSFEDNRFWKPERDKAGNGTATFRFLARTEGDELPWVKLFSHGFQGPTGRWYIENSLTTIGQPDPLGELNMRLWNSTTDDKSPERAQARAQKRKLGYIANVYMINDPKHPENNGKVFLFKFGKKIFDKIMDKARPTFEDQEPVNVFDYWAGANFKLRVKMVDKYPNYDTSEFESVAPLAGSDEAILEIAQTQYKLSEFMDAKNFKSYDELKKKLESVLSGAPHVGGNASAMSQDENFSAPVIRSAAAPQPVSRPAPKPQVSNDDDEFDLSYFASIANE